jgi:4-amino-4-deoxy-L-arabinose transferase-like glycosyltransferase
MWWRIFSPVVPGAVHFKGGLSALGQTGYSLSGMRNESMQIVWLFFLAAALYLTALGSRDFWAPVEPRYAEIARVMFLKNEWIVPTVNGHLYTDKPILYFWLVLIFSKLFGAVNEWTVRLPAALGGVGTVLTTYRLGKDFYNARIGMIAALALATSARVIWESRWAHLDMLFTFFFALAMWFAARALLGKGKRNEIILAYAFMALATLTKGLIGIVLPALILILFVAVRRDWRLVRDARLPTGIFVFLAIATPWFLLIAYRTHGTWLNDFVYIHHIQRYLAGAGHRQPIYYYLTTLPLDFLPWTVFLVPALLAYRAGKRLPQDTGSLFLGLWFLAVFFFFTLSSTKRELYLLPLFPPLALLVGNYMDDVIANQAPQIRFYRVLLTTCFAVFGLACFGLPVAAWFFRRDAAAAIAPFAVAMGSGSACIAYFAWRSKPGRVVASTALTMLFGVLTASMSFLPYLDRFKSPRPFSVTVKRIVPPNAPVYIYADTMNDFNFYMEREVIPVISRGTDLHALLPAGQTAHLLIRQRDLKRAGGLTGSETILATSGVDGGSWHLLALDHRPRP